MENLLELYRKSSQNPRIGGGTRNRDVTGTTQLPTPLVSKCVLGSSCSLHGGAVFLNASAHSIHVAAVVPSLLGLLVQGSRKRPPTISLPPVQPYALGDRT